MQRDGKGRLPDNHLGFPPSFSPFFFFVFPLYLSFFTSLSLSLSLSLCNTRTKGESEEISIAFSVFQVHFPAFSAVEIWKPKNSKPRPMRWPLVNLFGFCHSFDSPPLKLCIS
jgi:hypothetical protein